MTNHAGSAKRLLEASVLTVPLRELSPLDIKFENHGSIFLIRGISLVGQAWLDENVGDDETLFFGNAIVAEPRYVAAIAQGALDAGLVAG
jgi:hypothetical protein